MVWIIIQIQVLDQLAPDDPEDSCEKADVHNHNHELEYAERKRDQKYFFYLVVVLIDVIRHFRMILNYVFHFLLVPIFDKCHDVRDVEQGKAFVDSEHFYYVIEGISTSIHFYEIDGNQSD